MDALTASGETMQQKMEGGEMQHPIYFETSKYNSCNIRLKAVETLETCF
jgi:hypothetical protein